MLRVRAPELIGVDGEKLRQSILRFYLLGGLGVIVVQYSSVSQRISEMVARR